MNGPAVLRSALNLIAAAALLSGCGGPPPPIATTRSASPVSPLSRIDRVDELPHHKTFRYVGKRQRFQVPAHVNTLTVIALGAAGAAAGTTSSGRSNDYFGRGGRVYAVIPVTPGETLTVVVGGQGSSLGGYNGGGEPGPGYYGPCYGGGGASDARENGRSVNDRILVAAGGGGQGCGFDNASG
ncbi:MAG TPA: glycine-rich protein, partial [Candidatus Cybelea sp.]|nr:glycine-rich protein [Candidatus Cybelea sp.]